MKPLMAAFHATGTTLLPFHRHHLHFVRRAMSATPTGGLLCALSPSADSSSPRGRGAWDLADVPPSRSASSYSSRGRDDRQKRQGYASKSAPRSYDTPYSGKRDSGSRHYPTSRTQPPNSRGRDDTYRERSRSPPRDSRFTVNKGDDYGGRRDDGDRQERTSRTAAPHRRGRGDGYRDRGRTPGARNSPASDGQNYGARRDGGGWQENRTSRAPSSYGRGRGDGYRDRGRTPGARNSPLPADDGGKYGARPVGGGWRENRTSRTPSPYNRGRDDGYKDRARAPAGRLDSRVSSYDGGEGKAYTDDSDDTYSRKRDEKVDGSMGDGGDVGYESQSDGRSRYGDRQRNQYGNDRQRNQYGNDRQPSFAPRWDDGPPTAVRVAMDAAADDDLVYGISPVLLALQTGRRTQMSKLFVQTASTATERTVGPARKSDNNDALATIHRVAGENGVEVETMSKGDLNMLSNNRPHQGVVLHASKLTLEPLASLPVVTGTDDGVNENGRPLCYLVLDEVSDPQNAGALMRSAHFLGADGVILCHRNSCNLTPVVSKASAGAVEVMNVNGVTSMPRFLNKARENGWRVVGLAGDRSATTDMGELKLEKATVVVVGSEGTGLRTLVRNACEVVVQIQGGVSPDDPVDSLNVSVAGAIALYQLLGR